MEKVESVFKNRNYVLTFLGALVSNLAALFLNFATSFYILKLTDNNASIQGIYLAVCGVVFLLVSLFSGVLSDRFNKAKIMYICDYAKGALIIAGGASLLFVVNNQAQLALLFILGVLLNVIAAIFSPASQSILPFILKKEQLQQGNSYLSMMNNFQTVLGVVLAGLIYSILPFSAMMIIVGVCYLGSGVSEMFIRYEEDKKESKLTIKAAFSEIKESFVYLKSKQALSIFIIIVLFVNFFFGPINSNFMPYFVASDVAGNPDFLFHEFLKPEMWNSIITVAFCLGGIIGALFLSKRKQMDKTAKFLKIQFVVFSFLLVGVAIAYFVLVSQNKLLNPFLVIMTFSCLIIGVLISFINIPVSTVVAKACDKSMLGKVQSLLNVGSQGLIPLSSFLAGLAIQYLGNSALLFVCAGGFVLITALLVISRKVNEL